MVDRIQSPYDPSRLRQAEFPRLGEVAYLNAASYSPIPERSRRVLGEFEERRAAADLSDEELTVPLRRARAAAARLVGADPDEIALGWNASYGINLAALSLPVERGTTVVVSDREFPANVYPWMGREGTALEIVPADENGWPDEGRLLERLERGDVSVFALSSVQFATGWRADVERFGRICRERGIFFVVDAIQSLGQIPMDVRAAQIDVLAVGGHKWLCSPFGTGFAYVRRELIERMEPQWVGWTGLKACATLDSLVDYRYEFRDDARRFEGGTLPVDGFAGMAASLELLLEVGVEHIEWNTRAALEPLLRWLETAEEVEVLSDLTPERRSAIFSFRPPGAEEAYRALQEAGVVCSLREGAIRVAPHLYSTPDDLERVVEVLEGSRAARWS